MEVQKYQNSVAEVKESKVKNYLTILKTTFNSTYDETIMNVYEELCSEYSSKEIEVAINNCLKKYTYMPKVVELKKELELARQDFYYQCIEYAKTCGDLNNPHDLDDALMLVAKKLYPQWFKDRMKYYYLQMKNGTHEKFTTPKQDIGNIQDVFKREGTVESKAPKGYTGCEALKRKCNV